MTDLAFKATYADWKLIKTRGVVQVVMEIPLADADAAYNVLGGMPDVSRENWFAVAPLTPPAAKESPAKPQPDVPRSAGAKRMDWRDVQPAAQAAMRCSNATFWAFLRETRKFQVDNTEGAEMAVRDICGVNSRAEFSTDHRKRVLWHQLDTEFEAWLLAERVGA